MLFLQNHFLDSTIGTTGITIPDVSAVNSTNSPDTSIVGSLGATADQCAAVYGHAPNFLLVDWVDRGPAIDTVDTLNGIVGTIVGRSGPAAAHVNNSAGTGQNGPSGNGTGQTGGGSSSGTGKTPAAKGSAARRGVGYNLLTTTIFGMVIITVL
jgi:hypothetical protein